MSKKTIKKAIKKVNITESELVDLIDNIVIEAVAEGKKQWIAEQSTKNNSIIEGRIKELESKIQALTESKK